MTEALYFKVNGVKSANFSVYHVTNNPGNVYLDCYYDLYHQNLRLYEVDISGTKTQLDYKAHEPESFIRYEVPPSDRSYKHIYYCSDHNTQIQITLDYGMLSLLMGIRMYNSASWKF